MRFPTTSFSCLKSTMPTVFLQAALKSNSEISQKRFFYNASQRQRQMFTDLRITTSFLVLKTTAWTGSAVLHRRARFIRITVFLITLLTNGFPMPFPKIGVPLTKNIESILGLPTPEQEAEARKKSASWAISTLKKLRMTNLILLSANIITKPIKSRNPLLKALM